MFGSITIFKNSIWFLESFSEEKVTFEKKTFFWKAFTLPNGKNLPQKKWCLVMFWKEFFSYDQIGDYPQENVGKWKSSLGRFTQIWLWIRYETQYFNHLSISFNITFLATYWNQTSIFSYIFFSFLAIKTPIKYSFIFILFYFSPIEKWSLLTNLTATLHKVIDKKQLSMLSGLEVSPSCMHYLTNFFGRCPLTFKMVHQPIKTLFLKSQFVFFKRWSMFMKNKLTLLSRLHMFESSLDVFT